MVQNAEANASSSLQPNCQKASLQSTDSPPDSIVGHPRFKLLTGGNSEYYGITYHNLRIKSDGSLFNDEEVVHILDKYTQFFPHVDEPAFRQSEGHLEGLSKPPDGMNILSLVCVSLCKALL
jgi:hypothetical protein